MFFRHTFDGELFSLTIDRGGMGLLNGYFLRGLSVNGIRPPSVLRRLIILISSLGHFPDVISSGSELPKRPEQTIHFVGGVVMHKADAQDTTKLLDAEPLGEIQRVEISVPGENPAVTQKLCYFRWVAIA